MKYLGIDYGAKRVGLAVSDGSGTIAFPRETLENTESLIGELSRIVENEHIEKIIVGDTRALTGAPNPITEEADRFVEALTAAVPVPIEKIFEAFSSVEAARYTEGEKRDDAAAAIILQRYLDMHQSAIT